MEGGAEEVTLERAAEVLNASFARGRNPAVRMMQGSVVGFEATGRGSAGTLTMRFQFDARFRADAAAGSGSAALDGLASAALDAVCANAVVLFSRMQRTVATLEQKCSFLAHIPTDEPIFATATLRKLGRSVAFLEAELRSGDPKEGPLLARSSQCNALLALPAPRKPKL